MGDKLIQSMNPSRAQLSHQHLSWHSAEPSSSRIPAREARPRGVVAPLEEVYFQPEAGSAICVQSLDDSLNSAIRTTYRISLRSSSLLMPRYPSTRVVYFWLVERTVTKMLPNARGVDDADESTTTSGSAEAGCSPAARTAADRPAVETTDRRPTTAPHER